MSLLRILLMSAVALSPLLSRALGDAVTSPRRPSRSRHESSRRFAGQGGTVLHFTPSVGGGGAEAMLCNLVEEMQSSAWRQIVVAVKTGTTGCQAERMSQAADAFYDLNSRSLLRPQLFRELQDIIRIEQPDVVQTWMHHADFVGGVCARLAGVQNIAWGIHSRDIFRWEGDSAFKASLFKKLISLAAKSLPSRIISCSAAAIDDHEAMGYPRERMDWIANGICTRRFRPSAEAGVLARQQLGIPLDAPVIGFAGRFHPVKNLSLFFEAAALLQKKMPGAFFVLSGGSEESLDEKARSAFSSMMDRRKAHFVPFNPSPESLYPAFSVFSLCSDSEALPMALLEAMACGVPCAATDVGDCSRVIGSSGLVVPPRDAAALADAWLRLASLDEQAREPLSRRARRRVMAEFSIAHAAEQYSRAWSSMIAV